MTRPELAKGELLSGTCAFEILWGICLVSSRDKVNLHQKSTSGLNLTFESRLNEMLFQTSNLKNPIDTEEEIRSLL
jgi:hypothetical protein